MTQTGDLTVRPTQADHLRAAAQHMVWALPPEAVEEALKRLAEIWEFSQAALGLERLEARR